MLGSVEFEDQAVVADLEAGIGTLTRLADEKVDHVLVVVEPTPKSLEVGMRAADLAREKSLGRVIIVASRIRSEDDLRMVKDAFAGHGADGDIVPVPDDPAIVQADRNGVAPLDTAPGSPAVKALVELAESLLPVPA